MPSSVGHRFRQGNVCVKLCVLCAQWQAAASFPSLEMPQLFLCFFCVTYLKGFFTHVVGVCVCVCACMCVCVCVCATVRERGVMMLNILSTMPISVQVIKDVFQQHISQHFLGCLFIDFMTIYII